MSLALAVNGHALLMAEAAELGGSLFTRLHDYYCDAQIDWDELDGLKGEAENMLHSEVGSKQLSDFLVVRSMADAAKDMGKPIYVQAD
jgi:hypothetical protein